MTSLRDRALSDETLAADCLLAVFAGEDTPRARAGALLLAGGLTDLRYLRRAYVTLG